MAGEFNIRKSRQADAAAILSLYPRSFPDEDLVPLVRELLMIPDTAISLIAMNDSELAGHAVLTLCSVAGNNGGVALLGPVAVEPALQRQGVGTTLIRDGLRRMKETGVHLVCVLGDPAYYSRLGFVTESLVEPPYPLPAEWAGAWQSQYLGNSLTPDAGTLVVPSQWRDPALWGPDPAS